MTKINTITTLTIVSLVFLFIMSYQQFYAEGMTNSEKDYNDLSTQSLPADYQALNQVQDKLRELQQNFDDLQQQQNQLISLNESIVLRNDQHSEVAQDDNEQESKYSDHSNNAQQNLEQILANERITAEENKRMFNQRFDELWYQNADEEEDEYWAGEMEASFSDVQQQFADVEDSSTTMSSPTCGSRSCLVEFTHHDSANMGGSQLIDEAMPIGASQVIFKHIDEGGENKTLAIFMR